MMSHNEATLEPTQPNTEAKKKSLPTIWNIPDPLWDMIKKVLAVYDPPAPVGRKRSDERLGF